LKNDFTIRISVQSDKDSLREIIGLSFPRFFRFFASHSLDTEGKVLVSESKKRIVGFAKLTEFKVGGDKFGCVLWLAVHPDFRRQNVGTELVEVGTNCLLSHHAQAVFASIQRRNSASLATFRKAGFRHTSFLGLWRIFGWRIFCFYRKIWFAPGEIVLMHDFEEN
jgi:ribosomal protein S18 acetylase RimI-like enzyme